MWTLPDHPPAAGPLPLTLEDPMILALLACSEAHDEPTQQHTMRVAEWAMALGQAWGLDADALDNLALAAALHDVGKIAVPAEVLNKPGRLTDEEFVVMRRHAETTRHILDRLPWPAHQRAIPHLASSHHEKWNGLGYPRGLAGEDIPLEARIIAIADVFDALRSNRVYRPAMEAEVAIALMEKESGRSFEPALLSCFLEVVLPAAEVAERRKERALACSLSA